MSFILEIIKDICIEVLFGVSPSWRWFFVIMAIAVIVYIMW